MSDPADAAEPLHIIPGGATFAPKISDKDRAEQLRAQLRPLLDQACELITTARREGLVITFNLGPDQYGIQRVAALDILKPL